MEFGLLVADLLGYIPNSMHNSAYFSKLQKMDIWDSFVHNFTIEYLRQISSGKKIIYSWLVQTEKASSYQVAIMTGNSTMLTLPYYLKIKRKKNIKVHTWQENTDHINCVNSSLQQE